MKNKNIFIILGIILVLGVVAYYYWDKIRALTEATNRVMETPELREEARQRAAKNGTTVNEEAKKIAEKLV